MEEFIVQKNKCIYPAYLVWQLLSPLNDQVMWKNYIKIAARGLLQDKKHSLINVIGLSLGLATALLIVLFVNSEWTYDHFHANKDEIHRMWVKEFVEGDVFFNTETPLIMGDALVENFVEAKKISRFIRETQLLKLDDRSELELIHYAEPDFFDMFDFHFKSGSPQLSDPSQLVMTEKKAMEYFGYENVVGKTISIRINDEWTDFTVSGVLEKLPSNSSIQFDFLLPMHLICKDLNLVHGDAGLVCLAKTYVLLPEGLEGDKMQEKTAPFFDEQVKDQYEPGKYVVGFQPLLDIHLNKDFPVGIAPVSDARYPFILSAIAILILLLGGINYVSYQLANL